MSWETTELFFPDPFNSTVKQYADNAPYQYTEYDHLPESRIILQQDAGEAWKKNPVLTHYLTNESNTVLNCIRYQVNDKGTLYEDGVYDPGELASDTEYRRRWQIIIHIHRQRRQNCIDPGNGMERNNTIRIMCMT